MWQGRTTGILCQMVGRRTTDCVTVIDKQQRAGDETVRRLSVKPRLYAVQAAQKCADKTGVEGVIGAEVHSKTYICTLAGYG